MHNTILVHDTGIILCMRPANDSQRYMLPSAVRIHKVIPDEWWQSHRHGIFFFKSTFLSVIFPSPKQIMSAEQGVTILHLL